MTALSRFLERAMNLPPAQTRDIRVERNLPVPMPDGVSLLADRYVAAGAERPPLILVRSPYGRRGVFGTLSGHLFAERGFQSVVQSCRGTFGSGGQLDPFGVSEAADGLATVEWLRSQPWYPGSFGTWGPSYLGLTQWALATLALPDHQAMALQVASTRPRDLVRPNGSFGLETMLEWVDQVARQERPGAFILQSLRAGPLRKLADQLPLGDLDRLATGATTPYWQSWLSDDDVFWEQHQYGSGPGQVTAEIAMIGGWHDIFLPAQLRDYQALRAAGRNVRLTIGPWRHADQEAVAVWVRDGQEFLREVLTAQRDDAVLAQGDDPPQLPEAQPPEAQRPGARIFVTGADEWRDLPGWPPAADLQRWHLQTDGGLALSLPTDSQPDRFSYDPADPTPNLGGPVGNQGKARVDNRMLEARPDVITFTSAVLGADLEILGGPAVDLYVSSNREHTDFFARLCEVNPAGQSVNICDGLLRLAPGEPAADQDGIRRIRFELWPVAHRFAARSRLRLQVSSGAHPRYARNTGTGEPLATATELVTAEQQVYHDSAHPSAVILPVAG
jgi:uncharacterized protein